MEYETQNLILQKPSEEYFYDIWNNIWKDENVAKYMLWKPIFDENEAKERLKKNMNINEGRFLWYIILKETNECIGFAGMMKEENNTYEDCGLAIAEKYQGKGYGKEVLNAILDIAFNYMNGEKFIYSAFHENIISQNLAKKVGFKYSYTKEHIREYDNLKYESDFFEIRKIDFKISSH